MKRVGLWLVLSCGLLAASPALAQENGSGDPRMSQPRPSVLPGLRLEDLTATRDRPLFAANRRPQPPATPAPVAAEPQRPPRQRPDFALKGIISEGSSTFVLLEDLDSSEPIVARAGEKVGAWRVVVETDRTVTLVGEGERIRLQMFEDEAAASK
jgi:general secretion pathway protein N